MATGSTDGATPSTRAGTSPFSAGRWSVASFTISQTVGSLLYLPLARILSPDDFGLVAEAALLVNGLILVCEASLTRALIRLPGDRRELAQATLYLSVVVGLIGAALCALAGPPMAALFDEPRLRLILPLLAPAVLFSSLGTVPQGLLARDLDFRRRTLPETISIGGGGAAALLAAVAGAGPYSLVANTLVRQALATTVAWRVIGWRPARRRPDRETVRRILGFGLPASGGDLALYSRLNSDYAITGRMLGSEPLGIYSLAWNSASSPAAFITSFFGGVGYASFSRLQHDRARLRALYLSATRLIAALALPLFLGAAILRGDIVDALYDDRWAAMAAPLLPLFLLQGVREICRPGAGLTLATGHSRLYMACGLAMLPLTVTAVLIGARFGIEGVAWSMLIAVGGASLVWPTIAVAVLRPSAIDLWRTARVPLLLAAASTPAVAASQFLLATTPLPVPLRLLAAILAGFGAWLLAALLLRAPLQSDLALLRETLPQDDAPTDVEAAEPLKPPLPQPVPATVALPTAESG